MNARCDDEIEPALSRLRQFPSELAGAFDARYGENGAALCELVWRHVALERETYGVNIRLLLLESDPVFQPAPVNSAAPSPAMCRSVPALFSAARRANLELLELIGQDFSPGNGLRRVKFCELVLSMVESDASLARSLVRVY